MLCVGIQGYNRRKIPQSFTGVVNPAGSIPHLTHAAEVHLAQGATAGLYLTHTFISAFIPHAPAWAQEHPGTALTSLSCITQLTHPHQLLHSACFPENQSCYPTWMSSGDKKEGTSQGSCAGLIRGSEMLGHLPAAVQVTAKGKF